MAVEARQQHHLSLFPSQIPSNNREMGSFVEGNVNFYTGPMGYRVVPGPLSGTTTATDAFIPMYASSAMAADSSAPAKTPIKADSGHTYGLPASRKRSREAVISNHHHHHPLMSYHPNLRNTQSANNRCDNITFLGEDISYQIQQQQLEIDGFIAEHTEKVRMEIEERRKRYSSRIIAAVEESIVKKLREKEVEIEKIGKLNWVLEEKVKTLCVENQIWRDLAQTNEATANELRANLEQVLAQVQDDQDRRRVQQQRIGNVEENAAAAALVDDAESCCGSNYAEEEERKLLIGNYLREYGEGEDDEIISNGKKSKLERRSYDGDGNGNGNMMMLCRKCGKEESSVLLLPCRHLCLCTVCGPTLHTCPICKCTKNATLHVNLSFS